MSGETEVLLYCGRHFVGMVWVLRLTSHCKSIQSYQWSTYCVLKQCHPFGNDLYMDGSSSFLLPEGVSCWIVC